MTSRRLTGPEAWNDAMRKEKYGRIYNWIGWIDRDGEKQADIQTYDTIKEAMLAIGTQGRFRSFERGTSWMITWKMGSIMLRNAKRYYGPVRSY